jgi:hypothetical protein
MLIRKRLRSADLRITGIPVLANHLLSHYKESFLCFRSSPGRHHARPRGWTLGPLLFCYSATSKMISSSISRLAGSDNWVDTQ